MITSQKKIEQITKTKVQCPMMNLKKNNLIKELKRSNLNRLVVMRPGSLYKKASMQKILK